MTASSLRSRRVFRGALGVVGAALGFALAGCALLAQLTDEDFSAAEGGAPREGGAPSDATIAPGLDSTPQPPTDARPSDADAEVPVDAAQSCVFDPAGGWQLDCAFGSGGYLALDEKPGASPPFMVSAGQDLLIAGSSTPDPAMGFVDVFRQQGDASAGIEGTLSHEADTDSGTPTGILAGISDEAFALVSSDLNGGVALTVYALGGSVAFGPLFLAPDSGMIQTAALADFDTTTRSALLVVNHKDTATEREIPALAVISIDGGASLSDVALGIGAAQPLEQEVVGSDIGVGGGYLGVASPSSDDGGALLTLGPVMLPSASASLGGSQPLGPFGLLKATGMGAVLGNSFIALVGPTDGGFGAISYSPSSGPNMVTSVPVPAASVALVIPDHQQASFYAFALDETHSSVTMASFLASNAGGVSLDSSSNDGGVVHFELPRGTAQRLGSVLMFEDDLCFGLLMAGSGSGSQQDVIGCLRRGTGAADAGADAASTDSGDDASR